MRVLSVGLARSIWLFPLEDLNPRGLDVIPALNSIRTRYGFQKAPKIEEVFQETGGIQFLNGSFRLKDGTQIEIQSFTIYRDGLVAETRRDTATTDEFLAGLLELLTGKHAFERVPVRQKDYLSELIVSTGLDLGRVCASLDGFADVLSSKAGAAFQTSSIRFSTSPGPTGVPLTFSFEYRTGTPFDQKRYFSQAPVDTAAHISLLEEFEKIASPGGTHRGRK